MRICILFVFLLTFLGGCAGIQNLTTSEIRSAENLRGSWTLNKSIKEIQTSVFYYNQQNRPVQPLFINPSNGNEAIIIYSLPGMTRESVVLVVDFMEDTEKHLTHISAYTYYPTWEKFVTDIIVACQFMPKLEKAQ